MRISGFNYSCQEVLPDWKLPPRSLPQGYWFFSPGIADFILYYFDQIAINGNYTIGGKMSIIYLISNR